MDQRGQPVPAAGQRRLGTEGPCPLRPAHLRAWSQGQTGWGWFLDCRSAHDRTNRVPQRLLGLTGWGPILDHPAQFALDAWRYTLFGGDRSTVEPIFARLVRLLDYFETEYDEETGYGVESLPVPSVWIDHDAYRRQRHEQCAYASQRKR